VNRHVIESKLQLIQKRPTNLVSVILPTYNRDYVIWKAISSVLNQTHLNFELIIIDSGYDNTKKVIDQFIDPRVNYIKVDEKLNPEEARNLGIKNSKGDYVCYIDSDVTYHPEFIEYMLLSLLENPKKVIAYCAKNKVIVEYDSFGRIIERIEKIDCCKPVNIKELLLLREYIDTNVIMHKRDILTQVGGWDEKCEKFGDLEFVLRIYKAYPDGFLHVPRVMVDYVQIKGPVSDGVHANSDSSASKDYIKKKHYDLFDPVKREDINRWLK